MHREIKAAMILVLVEFTIIPPVHSQQSSSDLPSFDIAVVKPSSHPLTAEGYSFSDQKVVSPGRFRAVNSNLDELIRWAYDIEEYQLSEPGWLKSNDVTFDVEARASGETAEAQIRLMLRRLLSERFDMALHPEMREMAVYDLEVGKGGPKLQKATGQAPKIINFGHDHIKTAGTSMARLAAGLSRELRRPVIDKTGLHEIYVIDLQYAPPDALEGTFPLCSQRSGRPDCFFALCGLQSRSSKWIVPMRIRNRTEDIE